jgi:hypothetical protein
MSDLQILTGLSILISGYAQLRCGLSCYYWQVLVCLAWFSSLTHLSCLTALRNYLYHRPEERVWRVAAMGIIVIMLLVALVPTGSYNWTSIEYPEDSAWPNDFAICYFNPANICFDDCLHTPAFAGFLFSCRQTFQIAFRWCHRANKGEGEFNYPRQAPNTV